MSRRHNFHAHTSINLKSKVGAVFLASSGVAALYLLLHFWASCLVLLMEISDAGIRHAVAFNTLNIRHLIDLSPTTVSFAKEIRYCVIAVVIGFATTSVVKSVLNYRRRPD
jgi:hypothetical protein